MVHVEHRLRSERDAHISHEYRGRSSDGRPVTAPLMLLTKGADGLQSTFIALPGLKDASLGLVSIGMDGGVINSAVIDKDGQGRLFDPRQRRITGGINHRDTHPEERVFELIHTTEGFANAHKTGTPVGSFVELSVRHNEEASHITLHHDGEFGSGPVGVKQSVRASSLWTPEGLNPVGLATAFLSSPFPGDDTDHTEMVELPVWRYFKRFPAPSPVK